MLDLIIFVQPKEAGAVGAESREVVVTRQAKEMLEKVPRLYDMFEVKERCICCLRILTTNYFLKQLIKNNKYKI